MNNSESNVVYIQDYQTDVEVITDEDYYPLPEQHEENK